MEKVNLNNLMKYIGKYEVNFQLWGPGKYTIYLFKDDVELSDFGGCDTAQEAIDKCVEYLDRINTTEKSRRK